MRSGNLTIKSIKKDDHGKYECVLENIIATLVTTTTLLVDSNDYIIFLRNPNIFSLTAKTTSLSSINIS